MDIFTVINPGALTTIQDIGRFGFLDKGVPPSGALDSFACRVANLLVGNRENVAVLEITVMGPVLEAMAAADIAVTGAEMGMTINKNSFPAWQSTRVKKGDIIRIPRAEKGCRAYLATNGGFAVPLVMGSRATFVRAGFGGLQGRGLIKGDILQKGEAPLLTRPRIIPDKFIPECRQEILLRAIPGPQAESFQRALDLFFTACYEITGQSDRMGYRLRGPLVEHDPGVPKSIITEPVMPGNVQIPADGQPIILLLEQTTGGYSKIATVITADIGKIAQAMPGNRVRFERISLAEAHHLYRDAEKRIEEIIRLFN
ncbi:MAG: 5-oxoprolinase subunit C family protein [Syntrophales bacterium]